MSDSRPGASRGFQKAVVATARKMTVLAWRLVTKEPGPRLRRPGLVIHKRRKLELAVSAPPGGTTACRRHL